MFVIIFTLQAPAYVYVNIEAHLEYWLKDKIREEISEILFISS
jgi:hypothetical protein